MQDNLTKYLFFKKPMASQFCIMAKSEMSYNMKRQTLSQEGIRRLFNSSQSLVPAERVGIMNNFANKCLISGYSVSQVREIVLSSLKGYAKKISIHSTEPTMHRNCSEGKVERRLLKVLEKTDWYRSKPGITPPPLHQHKRPSHKPKPKHNPSHTTPPGSVIFVPRTPMGGLPRSIRSVEESLESSGLQKVRLKIVEESGIQISRSLRNSNPWASDPCERSNCTMCYGPGGGGRSDLSFAES